MNAVEARIVSQLVADELTEFKRTLPKSALSAQQVDDLFESIKGFVSRNVVPLAARIKALEESRAMTFEGAFDPSKTYAPGAVTQRQNKAWVALVSTSETPGASSLWRCLS